MTFISIGSKCNVKHQIDKHLQKRETLFFDWVGTDMETVNILLQTKNLKTYFCENNIIKSENNINGAARLYIKNLPKCVFIHDVPFHYSKKDIIQFIDKYTRRFNRLMEFIKSKKKLYFIRYGKIEENEKNIFCQAIYNINKNCRFYLISIVSEQENNSLYVKDNYMEFHLTDKNTEDWTTSNINWKYIFDTIKSTF
jgi:hypothetical protein